MPDQFGWDNNFGNSRPPSRARRIIGVDLASGPDRTVVHGVHDGRNGTIGSWEVAPLIYEDLGPQHIGRTVIYHSHCAADAGTITSWRNGIVFARYSRGDTAAGADPKQLYLAVGSLADVSTPRGE